MVSPDEYKKIIDKFYGGSDTKGYKICEIDFSLDDLKELNLCSIYSGFEKYLIEKNLQEATFSLRLKNPDIWIYSHKRNDPAKIDTTVAIMGTGTIGEADDYHTLIDQMLNRPEKVRFNGSLHYFDFMKIYHNSE